jgi:nitrile hydratase subunit beta
MNGIHDIGGMQGFGRIEQEVDEPVFHEEWERRTFGTMVLFLATGMARIPELRYSVERLHAQCYLETPYFRTWIHSIEEALNSRGFTQIEDLLPHSAPVGSTKSPVEHGPPLPRNFVITALTTGVPSRVESQVTPRFAPGDKVTAKNIHPAGHTRLPRYVRGKKGEIVRLHGSFAVDDRTAHHLSSDPEQVYSVRFSARELWGPSAPEKDALYIDLWESHLDAR